VVDSRDASVSIDGPVSGWALKSVTTLAARVDHIRARDLSRPLALVAALAAVALPGCDDGEPSPPHSTPALKAPRECRGRYLVTARGSHSPAELDRARRGVFDVFGYETKLEPPIDWGMDPHHSLRFQAYLSNLRFLDVLFYGYRTTGQTAYLRRALAIALDWIESNPRRVPEGGPGTWSGKVAGDRAPYLGYLDRAAACEDLLDRTSRAKLATSLKEHVRLLTDPALAAETNHGLYALLGLAALARQLPSLGRSHHLRALAADRFRGILEDRLAGGVWVEHSSSYQFLAVRVVEKFLRVLRGEHPDLRRDLRRMRGAAAWLTMPDGRETQFGDSELLAAPPGIDRRARRDHGVRLFRKAGLAVVRANGGYLAVTAWFHNTTHKHADELGFELYDGGRRVVTDTGLYESDPGRNREFETSARAHSVLTVDGRDFPIGDPRMAYGSGLVAAGGGDGWYAIEGRNPLLAAAGVRHRRLFLYRPGVALFVVDTLRSDHRHTYDRYLQLAPELRLRRRPGGFATVASGFSGAIYDSRTATPAEQRLVRGSHRPLAGLTSPSYRTWRPRSTLRLRARERDATHAISIDVGSSRLRIAAARTGGRGYVLGLAGSSHRSELRVTRRGRSLVVRRAPAR
jgi:hypothetical protein